MNSYYEKGLGTIVVGSVLAILGLSVVFGSFGTVEAGQRGVKTRMSAVVGTVEPGLYFKLPFIESIHKMDVRTLTINYDKAGDTGDEKDEHDNLFGASKDLQDVTIGIVVNYHINPAKVEQIFAQYKSVENYQASVLEPIIREVVKSTSASYTAEELVTKRGEFSDKVNGILAAEFASKDSILERFSVTNFSFSQAFSNAIEAKVTAVQNSEAAKNKLEQIKFEAQQTVEKAKAEAEAIRIQANAINSQGGADYVNLKAIEKWNGQLPAQMIPGGTVPFINLGR